MTLAHRFYKKTTKEQWMIQFWVLMGALAVILLFFWIAWVTQLYFIGIFIFWAVLTIIAPFVDVPSMKKSGKLIYHSSLFLTEKPKNGKIRIHGGTLFDYVFVIDSEMKTRERTLFILQQYVEGLLDLIDTYKNEKPDHITITGTSYIINKRTAERAGFTIAPVDGIQKLILIYNYCNVLLTYSIAKGKLSFPNINQTITFTASLRDIMEKRNLLTALNKKLKHEETH